MEGLYAERSAIFVARIIRGDWDEDSITRCCLMNGRIGAGERSSGRMKQNARSITGDGDHLVANWARHAWWRRMGFGCHLRIVNPTVMVAQ